MASAQPWYRTQATTPVWLDPQRAAFESALAIHQRNTTTGSEQLKNPHLSRLLIEAARNTVDLEERLDLLATYGVKPWFDQKAEAKELAKGIIKRYVEEAPDIDAALAILKKFRNIPELANLTFNRILQDKLIETIQGSNTTLEAARIYDKHHGLLLHDHYKAIAPNAVYKKLFEEIDQIPLAFLVTLSNLLKEKSQGISSCEFNATRLDIALVGRITEELNAVTTEAELSEFERAVKNLPTSVMDLTKKIEDKKVDLGLTAPPMPAPYIMQLGSTQAALVFKLENLERASRSEDGANGKQYLIALNKVPREFNEIRTEMARMGNDAEASRITRLLVGLETVYTADPRIEKDIRRARIALQRGVHSDIHETLPKGLVSRINGLVETLSKGFTLN